MTGRGSSTAAPEHEPIQADPAAHAEPEVGVESEHAAPAPVAGLATRRLEVGSAHAAEEHRADAVADRVVEALAADDAAAGQTTDDHSGHSAVRRSSAGAAATIGAAGGALGQADSDLISAKAGTGTPLGGAAKQRLSRAMGGADLSAVRIHGGPDAKALNERMSAAAFTVGSDIYFRDGAPDLSTGAGRRIMAHELAHAVGADGAVHRLLEDAADEKEAEEASGLMTGPTGPDEDKSDSDSDSDSDTTAEHEQDSGEQESGEEEFDTALEDDKTDGDLATDLDEQIEHEAEEDKTDGTGSDTAPAPRPTRARGELRRGKKGKGSDEKKDTGKKPGFFAKIRQRKEDKKQKAADEEKAKLEDEAKAREKAENDRKAEQARLAQERIDKRTKDYGAIGALSLAELEKYATDTPDWAKNSTIDNNRPARINQLVTFAGEAESGACPYKVVDLLKVGSSTGNMTSMLATLRVYGAAVQNDPFPISQAATLDEAITAGKDLQKVIGAFPRWVLASAMTEEAFDELRSHNYLDDLIAYYTGGTKHPTFQAEDGRDFIAYLEMRTTDGVDPCDYQKGELKDYVRNFHRFEARLLDRLVLNFKDTAKKLPLTLILHSALDHNGAFHRDPEMFKVVDSTVNNTLMVEGGDSLDTYKSQITPLAKKYGVNDKIDQVMFAGHGNAQSIEMAGGIEDDGEGRVQQTGEDLNVETGAGTKAKTEELFDAVLANMDGLPNLKDPKQPHRRILFNACLTNSNLVDTDLTGDEANGRKQIREWIKKNMSLATFLNDRAKKQNKDVTALGANASITQVELIDNTGGLDLVTAQDPKVTASKLEYAQYGKEPTGVLRAALECFGNDRKSALTAMKARMAATSMSSSFDDLIIWSAYAEFIDERDPSSAGALNDLRILTELVEDFSHLKSEAHASLASLRGWLKIGWGRKILDTLIQCSDVAKQPKQGLMIKTARLAIEPNRADLQTEILTLLDNPVWTVKTALVDAKEGRYLDVGLLDEIGALATMLTGPTTRGKLVLALAGQVGKTKPAPCTTYLQGIRKPAVAEVPGLAAVPEVPEVPEKKAPRELVPEVPEVKGRAKVEAIPGQRKEYPEIADLPKLEALEAVPAPKDKKVVMAKGRKGRTGRDAVDPVPRVEAYFDETLKIDELLGGASTVKIVLKSL